MSEIDEVSPTAEYIELRGRYWNAQAELRHAGINEMVRLAPPEVAAIILQITDAPRLGVQSFLDAAGADISEAYEETPLWQALEMIASDMEAYDWDEADSFLLRYDEGFDTFIIRREDADHG